mmetsp:Transcript_45765/g.143160  ORF Transcript_45765/g.143160 Transcript_45765/m.143160 type:complete len:207 (+) Transcript_45765:241-861(+)
MHGLLRQHLDARGNPPRAGPPYARAAHWRQLWQRFCLQLPEPSHHGGPARRAREVRGAPDDGPQGLALPIAQDLPRGLPRARQGHGHVRRAHLCGQRQGPRIAAALRDRDAARRWRLLPQLLGAHGGDERGAVLHAQLPRQAQPEERGAQGAHEPVGPAPLRLQGLHGRVRHPGVVRPAHGGAEPPQAANQPQRGVQHPEEDVQRQ